MNSNASVVGLDIAKNVFVAVGVNERGKQMFKKKLARDEVLAFFANLPTAEVGIEACSGLTCAVNSGHQTIRQLPTLSSEL